MSPRLSSTEQPFGALKIEQHNHCRVINTQYNCTNSLRVSSMKHWQPTRIPKVHRSRYLTHQSYVHNKTHRKKNNNKTAVLGNCFGSLIWMDRLFWPASRERTSSFSKLYIFIVDMHLSERWNARTYESVRKKRFLRFAETVMRVHESSHGPKCYFSQFFKGEYVNNNNAKSETLNFNS